VIWSSDQIEDAAEHILAFLSSLSAAAASAASGDSRRWSSSSVHVPRSKKVTSRSRPGTASTAPSGRHAARFTDM